MKKQLTKRQRIFIFVAVVIAVAAAFTGILLMTGEEKEKEVPESQIIQTIPEADLEETEGTKTDSYRRGDIGDYWDSLEEDTPASSAQEPDSAPGRAASAPPANDRHPGAVVVDDLFGEYRDAPAAPSGGASPSSGRRSSGGSRSSAGTAPVPPSEPSETPAAETETESEPRRVVKRSGAISSLDEDVTTDLGNGFSTLDGTDRWVSAAEGKPYRCMFIRDEKVHSGQRITVRLLEDLVIGGIHIPKNTHLQGVCTISDRMEVSISSLDMGGRIVSLGFEAFDTDGGKGIYCSDLSQVRQEITEQGVATVSTGLSNRLGRVARDAAAVGASIVRNKAGEATVSVPAGYTFYIMEEKR